MLNYKLVSTHETSSCSEGSNKPVQYHGFASAFASRIYNYTEFTGDWSNYTPQYEVYRGYVVFAFSVIMFVYLFIYLFVCLSVCLSVNIFSVKYFSATTWVRILKFGTKLDCDELYYVTIKQPHIPISPFICSFFLSL